VVFRPYKQAPILRMHLHMNETSISNTALGCSEAIVLQMIFV